MIISLAMLISLYDVISWNISVTWIQVKSFHEILRYLFLILAATLIPIYADSHRWSMKLYSNLKKQLKLEISWLNYPYLFFIYLVHVIDYILLALMDKNSSFIKLSTLTFFGNVLIDKLIIAYPSSIAKLF